MRKTLTSPAYVTWSFLLLYLTTRVVHRKYDALLLNDLRFNFDKYGDGWLILLLYFIYLVALFYIVKKYAHILERTLNIKQQIFLHASMISYCVLVASIFLQPDFDLMLKLGLIWSLAMIQYFARNHDKEIGK